MAQAGIPEGLAFALGGYLDDGRPMHRETLLELTEERPPFAAGSRVWVYAGEMAGGQVTDWHIHQGPVFHVILQGRVRIESGDSSREYVAGDSYTEPVGEPHRAVNAEPDVPIISVTFQVLPPGVDDAVTSVDEG